MIFEFLFGKSKPTAFEQSRLPAETVKFTASDAKKYLREFLKEIEYDDADGIRSEVELFGEYISDCKVEFKDQLDSIKEEIKYEKEILRDCKSEVSDHKKQNMNLQTIEDKEWYQDELNSLLSYVKDQENVIQKASDKLELQKQINSHVSSFPRRALPVYANKIINYGQRPIYDLNIPIFPQPVRIHLTYQSQRAKENSGLTERVVDISNFSAESFQGYCHLRGEPREFIFEGVKAFGPSFTTDNDTPLLEFLISRLPAP